MAQPWDISSSLYLCAQKFRLSRASIAWVSLPFREDKDSIKGFHVFCWSSHCITPYFWASNVCGGQWAVRVTNTDGYLRCVCNNVMLLLPAGDEGNLDWRIHVQSLHPHSTSVDTANMFRAQVKDAIFPALWLSDTKLAHRWYVS